MTLDSAAVDQEAEYRKQRYDAYVRERQAMDANLLALSERYGKALLALSGGSLALSVTFLEKIAPHPQNWSLGFLIAGWGSLIVCVVSELLGMHASQEAIVARQEIDQAAYGAYLASVNVEPRPAEQVLPEDTVLRWNRRVQRCGIVALSALIFGLILLCAFSITNVCFPRSAREKPPVSGEKKQETTLPPGISVVPPAQSTDPRVDLTYRVPTDARLPPQAVQSGQNKPTPSPPPASNTSQSPSGQSSATPTEGKKSP